MLDRVLKNALEGVTVIEDETGSVSSTLASQLGGYAKVGGKKVIHLSMEKEDRKNGNGNELSVIRGGSRIGELTGGGISAGSQVYGGGQRYVFLEGLSQDVVIIDSLSTYLFDKTEKETTNLIKEILKLAREKKKNFIITYDKGLVSERTAAYLRATADSVIVVKTELMLDRVTRMLYVPKLRDSRPLDKLIKITIDEAGVQEDTREFVG